MHIAVIAPPFIEVPPRRYGGTELFVANLATALHARGLRVTVFANGESRLPCEVAWRYPRAYWPIDDPLKAQLANADHTAWAMSQAARTADVIHLNDVVGVPFMQFVDKPTVLTIHHPHEPALSDLYVKYPQVHYVGIAAWVARQEVMPQMHVVPHGIPCEDYTYCEDKDDYVAFLGRMAPCKGPHLAIEAARIAGVRIKLAGEVQPVFKDYWKQQVEPHLDGDRVQYVGEADFAQKNTLLSKARALLFPIQWQEPFGLVMVEAMACGTPVLAFAGGAVEEIVRDGVNGYVCRDVVDMAAHIAAPAADPAACRASVAERFSVARMADRYLGVYARARHRSASLAHPER